MATPPRSTPDSALTQTVHTPNNLLTANEDLPTAGLTTPTTASAPQEVIQIQDPKSLRFNDIHTFPKGSIVYRGDSSFKDALAKDYGARFFTLEPTVARTYSPIVVKLTLQRDIRLLRLDRNADGFHNWLQTKKGIDGKRIEILYKNFGYPNEDSRSTASDSQARARVSEREGDNAMLDLIKDYAADTGQTIDGYYTDIMTNGKDTLKNESGGMSTFHAELAVFDNQTFGSARMHDQLPPEQITQLNQEANLRQLGEQVRLARKNKKRRIADL